VTVKLPDDLMLHPLIGEARELEQWLERLPAFVFVRVDGELVAKAEGWNPSGWREVAEVVAETAYWSAPLIPMADDPSPFAGSRAAG